MKISAITKFKVGVIYEALRKLGWSQKKLAKEADIHWFRVYKIINLRRRPTEDEAMALEIALARAGAPVEIDWPGAFEGLKQSPTLVQTCDISTERLLQSGLQRRLTGPNPLDELLAKEGAEAIEQAKGMLREREAAILDYMYKDDLSLTKAAKKLGIHRTRVQQIKDKALRKLRQIGPANVICGAVEGVAREDLRQVEWVRGDPDNMVNNHPRKLYEYRLASRDGRLTKLKEAIEAWREFAEKGKEEVEVTGETARDALGLAVCLVKRVPSLLEYVLDQIPSKLVTDSLDALVGLGKAVWREGDKESAQDLIDSGILRKFKDSKAVSRRLRELKALL